LAEKVEPVSLYLKTLLAEVENLDRHRQALQIGLDNYDARESLSKINLALIKTNIRTEIEQLQRLQQRFSRPTLNIGVVGWTGQGKSTFLQSLSGLSDNEIPAHKGGACTAVRSKIEHHDGDINAIVTLHNRDSFLKEVITPYYEKLGLGIPPQTLDEFANLPFPNPPNGITNQNMYDHLRYDYYLPLRNYRSLLESEAREIVLTKKEEIAQYVVQKRDSNKRLITFNHLAVREVKISCRFSKTEVKKLALIDVPGLGDTRLGDEDLMLQTLGKEIDIVLFLKKPDGDRFLWKHEDTNLYEKASQSLPDFHKRVFLVLNHKPESQNLDACRDLRDNVGKMVFVRREIANCANLDEANRVLEVILQYLNDNIQTIEQNYAQIRQNNLIALYQAIQTELSQADVVMRPFTQENKLFQKLFTEQMQNITNGLRDLLIDLAKEQNTIDRDFEVVVKKALADCAKETCIPSETEIRDRTRSLDLKDIYSAAYLTFIPELRADLSRNFLSLDDGLQEAANQLKKRVADVLIKKANLGKITDKTGEEFLAVITEILAARDNKLELGFRTLSEFNISYGALVLRLIRQNLMTILNPNNIAINIGTENIGNTQETTSEQTENKSPATGFEFNPTTVRENLQKLQQTAIAQCEETLNRWLEAPSQIRYYMATEFCDRVLDANNMKDEWDEFLREPEISSLIWKEFGDIEKMKIAQQDWQTALHKVLQLNQRSRFEFFN
jgi:energy-coupling factor transporter ATP-binding protein EcfA2